MHHKLRGLAYLLSSYQHNLEQSNIIWTESKQESNTDRTWQWLHSDLDSSCFIFAECWMWDSGASFRKHPLVPAIPTWGRDFTDLDISWAHLAALLLDATLQRIQHSLLWELRHDLQVTDWNIKLGPVISYHAFAGVRTDQKWTELRSHSLMGFSIEEESKICRTCNWVSTSSVVLHHLMESEMVQFTFIVTVESPGSNFKTAKMARRKNKTKKTCETFNS